MNLREVDTSPREADRDVTAAVLRKGIGPCSGTSRTNPGVTGRRDGHDFPEMEPKLQKRPARTRRGRNVTARDETSPGEQRALFQPVSQ